MIFLGVDCGTQSTKTIALDAETGRILASASQAHDLLPGLPPGHMEQHPSVWTDALNATVIQVVEKLGSRRNEVKGIGVSGQQHGFVALDREGKVIRPAKLWCDTSTAEECKLLNDKLGGAEKVIGRVGLAMLPGYTAPKILWLKRHEPDNFARLASVLLPHDYLNFHLTGKIGMEYGDASGTALLDISKRQWAAEVIEAIDSSLFEKLPALGSSRDPIGFLKPDLAKQWNLPAGIVVSAGGGDNMMGAIGTGNTVNGRVTASLGTSGTIYAYSDAPILDFEGAVAGFCDSTDAWLPLVCTMNVTVATEAVRKLFHWTHAQLEEAVCSVPAGADDLLFLPYLQGERTPNLPQGTGVLHGLTTRNMTPAHMARATMEGATMGLAYGLECLRRLGIAPAEIRLTGGGSQSPAWRQICANIFNCRVVTLKETEGAALGAAIQALACVEKEKSIHAWTEKLIQVNQNEISQPQENGFDYAQTMKKQVSLTRVLAREGFL